MFLNRLGCYIVLSIRIDHGVLFYCRIIYIGLTARNICNRKKSEYMSSTLYYFQIQFKS